MWWKLSLNIDSSLYEDHFAILWLWEFQNKEQKNLRPLIRQPSQWRWRTMSRNSDKTWKLKAKVWRFRTFEGLTRRKSSRFLNTKLLYNDTFLQWALNGWNQCGGHGENCSISWWIKTNQLFQKVRSIITHFKRKTNLVPLFQFWNY